ncbi:MAG: MFS transporter [Thermoanaerobaculaceae bacterium]|nr:MFS transporter [Thermoanaerobaculaceae bacterium]
MGWFRAGPPEARRALLAAWLGWALDGMDVMLYAMVLAHLMRELGMSAQTGGLLASLTLASSAVGGAVVGVLADRLGRTWAMRVSILVYSLFTAACGLARTVPQLAVFRVFLGLGMGGEWATGAALVAETWPSEHRGKALGVMQSAWAVGYAAAAAVTALVLPRLGWRAVFFVGVLPALVTFWIRRHVQEPEVWRSSRRQGKGMGEVGRLFRPPWRRWVAITSTVSAATMFAWWGLFTWIPSYLGLPVSAGGAGLSIVGTSTWVVLMQVGMWLGYLTFGALADRLGRKRAYVGYLLVAAALVGVYGSVRDATALLLLGPLVAFFGTGYFVGFGTITAELFPTSLRATAQGFTYNVGRGISAIAPLAVGSLALRIGLGSAFKLVTASFLLAAVVALWLPETRGRRLDDGPGTVAEGG